MKRKTVRAQQRRSGRLNAAAKKHRTVLFSESLLLQFVISSTRPDRHVGALIGILERLGYILRLISGNHLLIDRIVLIGFARNDHVDELTKVRIRLRIQIFREN